MSLRILKKRGKDHASEGLSCLSPERILLHRCIRCFRYASSGCEKSAAGQRKCLRSANITEEQLPKLYESWQVVGNLKAEVAKELGFSEDVKVVAGAGDNAAAAVGTGTVGDGQCNISLGTSGTIFISSKDFGVDENNALHSFDHADWKLSSDGMHVKRCFLQQMVVRGDP